MEVASLAAFGLSAVELVTAVALSVLTSPLAWANGRVCLEYWEQYISSCLFTHTWAFGTAINFNVIVTNRWSDEDSARTGMATNAPDLVGLRYGLIGNLFLSVISLQVGMALYFGVMVLQSYGRAPRDDGESWCREYLVGPKSLLTDETKQAIRDGDPSSFSFVAAHAVNYYGVVKRTGDVPNWLAADSKRFIETLRWLVTFCLQEKDALVVDLEGIAYERESIDRVRQNWIQAAVCIRDQRNVLECLENLVPKDLDLFNKETRDWPKELEWLFQRIKTKSHLNIQMDQSRLMQSLSNALKPASLMQTALHALNF